MPVALQQLIGLGTTYVDPLSVIVWEAAQADRPWLPPRLLTLQGLAQERMLRASRLDFARFAAAELWLRTTMLRRLGRADLFGAPIDDARMALSRTREEAGLGLLFLESIDRAGLGDVPLLPGRATLEKCCRGLGEGEIWAFLYAAGGSLEAFAERALAERRLLCPMARQILELYRRQAGSHLASLRYQAEESLSGMSRWRRAFAARRLSRSLGQFLAAAFFPSREGLEWVGLEQAETAARLARRDPARWSLARSCILAPRMEMDRLGLAIDLRGNESHW